MKWLSARYIACVFAALVATAAIAQDAAVATPPRVSRPHVVTIGFRGQIKALDVERLRQAIALAGAEPLPARLIVFFDSSGGDGLAAMRIGRMLRYAKAHVFVVKRCASACIFAYVGGVFRDARPGALGIHRGRITRAMQSGKSVDVDPRASPVAQRFLTDAEAQTQEHLQEMGMPPALFEAMQAVSSHDMRWLSAEEAADLGLTGFDPEYLAARSAEMQAKYGLSQEEYVRRSHTVLERCGDLSDQHSAFVKCYRTQLLSPSD